MKISILWLLVPIVAVSFTEAAKNYGDALKKSILFYDAQRSGKLPSNNPIHWRGDSALHDCVPGGWYDAGDHVKFGLPLSGTVTILAWSMVAFKDGYQKAGQLTHAYTSIKWALDYMLDAWDAGKQELTVQVGDGNADHAFWGRPEDMTMARPCKVVNSNHHGSDIAGGTAAAMAAGSIVFKAKGDTSYANRLLGEAKSLYNFAKSHRGSFQGAAPFYSSSGDKDDMCEGAIWLYKATKENHYLNDAKSFGGTGYTWAYGWDQKLVGCQALIYEATHDGGYKNAVENYFTGNWFPGHGMTYTPCGLAWRDKWGANRWAGNSAFIALIAGDLGIIPSRTRTWAVEQINYLLGDNHVNGGCLSFEIGYGSKYPRQPHHRGASCPDRPAPCGQAQLGASGPSPQTLNGGLVGGPDQSDHYQDKRTDYVMNEVAIDYNAGFQGALAGILHLQAHNQMPQTHNKCPCNN